MKKSYAFVWIIGIVIIVGIVIAILVSNSDDAEPDPIQETITTDQPQPVSIPQTTPQILDQDPLNPDQAPQITTDQSTPSTTQPLTEPSTETTPEAPDASGLPTNWDELTNLQKVQLNPFNCDQDTHWISAETGACLIKRSTKQIRNPYQHAHTVGDSEITQALYQRGGYIYLQLNPIMSQLAQETSWFYVNMGKQATLADNPTCNQAEFNRVKADSGDWNNGDARKLTRESNQANTALKISVNSPNRLDTWSCWRVKMKNGSYKYGAIQIRDWNNPAKYADLENSGTYASASNNSLTIGNLEVTRALSQSNNHILVNIKGAKGAYDLNAKDAIEYVIYYDSQVAKPNPEPSRIMYSRVACNQTYFNNLVKKNKETVGVTHWYRGGEWSTEDKQSGIYQVGISDGSQPQHEDELGLPNPDKRHYWFCFRVKMKNGSYKYGAIQTLSWKS